MLDEYQDLLLDLGSIQYLGVAMEYTNLVRGKIELVNYDLSHILKDSAAFKAEMDSFFENIYKIYTEISLSKRFKDLDPELIDAANIWDEEKYDDIKNYLSDNPFRFPIKIRKDTNMIKLAISAWFDYSRYSACDLWSVCGYLNGYLDSTGDENYSYSDNINIGKFLYVLHKVYNFTHAEIQKIAGDFDT